MLVLLSIGHLNAYVLVADYIYEYNTSIGGSGSGLWLRIRKFIVPKALEDHAPLMP